MSRSCVECKHWYFDPGTSAWSEVTPGDEWDSCCRKNHWNVGSERLLETAFGKLLLTARTCADFELADYAKEPT